MFLPAHPEPAETGSFPVAVRRASERRENKADGIFNILLRLGLAAGRVLAQARSLVHTKRQITLRFPQKN